MRPLLEGGPRAATPSTPAKKPTPAAPVTPAPAPKPRGFQQPLGHFSWGFDPATRRPWTPAGLERASATSPALARDLKALLRKARTSVDTPLPTLARLHSEGLLASDPKKQKTSAVLRRFDDVFAWAVAARAGPPALQAKSQAAAVSTLLSWAKKYEPTGNPIDEHRFLPMFQAADLVLPLMTAAEQQQVRGWLGKFVTAGERFPLEGMCQVNNWKTFSLKVRGTAAQVLGDQAALKRVSRELDGLLKKTLRADGSSLDFHHRDALHYHLYNSMALLDLATSAQGVITPASLNLIEKSFAFVKPYYLGTKQHVEFANTQVAFDRYRGEHGEAEYQPHRWDPRAADALLVQARAFFPSLREWTTAAEAKGAGGRTFGASLRWPARP